MVLLCAPVSQPVVLLTGFDAFGGAVRNPSWEAVRPLHGRVIDGHRVVSQQLPTRFDRAVPALSAALDRHRPTLVLCVGQAGGRDGFAVERVAVNWIDAPIADNAGVRPGEGPVIVDAPVAYFSTLPVSETVAAVRAAGIPVAVSMSAGTFVCNQVFFWLMHRLACDPPRCGTRGGFIHVPWMPGQGTPALALEDMVRGLREIVAAVLRDDTATRQPADSRS